MSTMSPDDLTRNFRTKISVCSCDGCVSDPSGPCWLFARTDRNGYGLFKFRDRNVVAHRFAFERLVGPIPSDLTVDHLCDRHRNCVFPEHFELVSGSENSRRANRRRWDA